MMEIVRVLVKMKIADIVPWSTGWSSVWFVMKIIVFWSPKESINV